MNAAPPRIGRSEDLGRARRWLDVTLGVAAIAPLAALAGLSLGGDADARGEAGVLAAIWSGALLAFFSGVRRGLTFSEARGARGAELWTFLTVFALGVLTVAFSSPGLGAAGFALVGVLDAVAAARREAPGYFRRLRPLQMSAGALSLALVAWRVA